jgi:hypothetical protein
METEGRNSLPGVALAKMGVRPVHEGTMDSASLNSSACHGHGQIPHRYFTPPARRPRGQRAGRVRRRF